MALGLGVGLVGALGAAYLLGAPTGTAGQDVPRPGDPAYRGPPTILWVIIDTLRADHVGCYGYPRPTTPHLDALAAEALLFERATSPAPWTNPAIAAMLTGRHPAALGESVEGLVMPRTVPHVAAALGAGGYGTAGIVSHWFIGRRYGFNHHFAHWDEENARDHDWVSSDSLTDKALAWLDGQEEAPSFLLVHYFDPHWNYIEHEAHRFADPNANPTFNAGGDLGEIRRLARTDALTREEIQHLRDLYDSEIAFTDEHVGRLLAGLRQRGRFDDALIVVTADHGEAFLDRPNRFIGHTRYLYEELLHVPLVIKLPGQREGRRVAARVSTVDLMPTVLEVSGVEVPDPAANAARSLLAATGERAAFAETQRRANLQSVTLDDWKLIWNPPLGTAQLYDLDADPKERRDVAELEPEIRERLQRQREAWLSECAELRPASSERPPELNEQEIESLRALGYLDPADN